MANAEEVLDEEGGEWRMLGWSGERSSVKGLGKHGSIISTERVKDKLELLHPDLDP